MRIRLLPACMVCGVFLIACDRVALIPDDLEGAREAAQQRDWLQAERLLERYLRTEEKPAQRWEAWARLLEIRDRSNPDPKVELLYLETMLPEFSHDEAKLKVILLRLGALRENLGQTARALAVWTRLVDIAGLTDKEAADIQRRIGNLHFRQRRFDLAEEALQTCRALPVDESVHAWCLYDLALANMARDELEDARDQAMQVLSMHVDDQLRGLAGFLLADVLEQQGQRAEALQRFESVRALYPNEMVVDNRIAYLKKRLQQTPGGR